MQKLKGCSVNVEVEGLSLLTLSWGLSCGITARRGRSVDVEVKGVILVDLELGWRGLRGVSQVIAVQHMVFAGAVPLHLPLLVLLMT